MSCGSRFLPGKLGAPSGNCRAIIQVLGHNSGPIAVKTGRGRTKASLTQASLASTGSQVAANNHCGQLGDKTEVIG